MTHKKSTKFGLGLVFGAVAGAVAGLFLAPKAGKEMREDAKNLYDKIYKDLKDKEVDVAVKKIFGKVTSESKEIYTAAQKELAMQLSELGKNYKKVDKKKYLEVVGSVITRVKDERELPDSELKALGKHLEGDFKKLFPAKKKKKAPAKKKATPKKGKKVAKK